MQSKKKDNKSFKKTKGDEKMPISNKGEELAMIAVLRGGTNNRAEIRLHSGDPGSDGTTNTLSSDWTASGGGGTGGANVYPQTTWTIPVNTGVASNNSEAVSFTRTSSTAATVRWISVWKAGGTPTFVWKAQISDVTWSLNQTITFEINAIKLDLGN
jgi:hypothetical protein